jgi:hypothetical protein
LTVISFNSLPFFEDPFETLNVGIGESMEYRMPLYSDPDGDEVSVNVTLGKAADFVTYDD